MEGPWTQGLQDLTGLTRSSFLSFLYFFLHKTRVFSSAFSGLISGEILRLFLEFLWTSDRKESVWFLRPFICPVVRRTENIAVGLALQTQRRTRPSAYESKEETTTSMDNHSTTREAMTQRRVQSGERKTSITVREAGHGFQGSRCSIPVLT